MIKTAARDTDFKLAFDSAAGVDFHDCWIRCSCDSAFANAVDHGEKIESLAGYVLSVRTQGGRRALLGNLDWRVEASLSLYLGYQGR